MKSLPEFRVSLTRLSKGETAYPTGPGVSRYEHLGTRTKLGGVPDWIQNDEVPVCEGCEKPMVFVAQIDSVENDSDSNPHAI